MGLIRTIFEIILSTFVSVAIVVTFVVTDAIPVGGTTLGFILFVVFVEVCTIIGFRALLSVWNDPESDRLSISLVYIGYVVLPLNALFWVVFAIVGVTR